VSAPRTEPLPSVDQVLSHLGVDDVHHARVRALAQRLYGHVFRTVDGRMLYEVEQILWSEIDRLGIHDEQGDLATALIAEALFRVGHDPERCHDSIPLGVTPAEQIAAAYEDDCLLCRHELREAIARESGQRCGELEHARPDAEWIECQEAAADAWRARHVDALRRFGLA